MSLADVKPEHTFLVKNGKQLKNLVELEQELEQMDDATFQHHVTDEKNDFYNWIKHSVKDAYLAKQLVNIKDRELMRTVLLDRIEELRGPRPPVPEPPQPIPEPTPPPEPSPRELRVEYLVLAAVIGVGLLGLFFLAHLF
jgi:hypothetical protein